MSEKSDEIDRDFGSFTLSLSTPLRPLKLQDKVPVKDWMHEYPFDVSDGGERRPKDPGGSLFRKRPRLSGQFVPEEAAP